MAHQLTLEERDRLAQLRCRHYNQKEIAAHLGRSPSTISRELKRNSTRGEYLSGQAHRQAVQRRRQRPLTRKMDRPAVNAFVRRALASCWSPDEAAGRLRLFHRKDPQSHVSAGTIYGWIERQGETRNHWRAFLRRRGKRPYRRANPPDESRANAALAHRPRQINERTRLGDFEGDTVLGPPGTGGMVTLVDRRSRYTLLAKIKTKHADHVHHKIKGTLRSLRPDRRRSITFDNGTEFSRCYRLEKHLGIQLYWAEPGCPYQRGTNENTNGLLRQFFPKGTDFTTVTHHELREAQNLINNRPRACLGYLTPAEVFLGQSPPTDCDSS